jgi:beta-1,4-N-acetylglucosaminyltransferase
MQEVLFEEMIFVTVGTSNLGFERLIKMMDEIAGKLDEEIIMQIGKTEYKPSNAEWFTFMENEKILEFYNKADLIIAHDGAGTLLTTLSLNKPTVIIPRLKKYGECGYENKFDLAEALNSMGKIEVVYEIQELERVMKIAKSLKNKKILQNKELINFLKTYITELDKGKK